MEENTTTASETDDLRSSLEGAFEEKVTEEVDTPEIQPKTEEAKAEEPVDEPTELKIRL